MRVIRKHAADRFYHDIAYPRLRADPADGYASQLQTLPQHTPNNHSAISVDDDPSAPRQRLTLLTLPPEIRNQIHRYVLVSPRPIVMSPLKFRVGDTNILAANRQLHAEAVEIFYYWNTFVIPEALFVGSTAILDQLKQLYKIPRDRLGKLKSVKCQVPVYGRKADPIIKDQAINNLYSLCLFFATHGRTDLKIAFRFQIAWGQHDADLGMFDYNFFLQGPVLLHRARREVAVVLHLHPSQQEFVQDSLCCFLDGRYGERYDITEGVSRADALRRKAWLRAYVEPVGWSHIGGGQNYSGVENIRSLLFCPAGQSKLIIWANKTSCRVDDASQRLRVALLEYESRGN